MKEHLGVDLGNNEETVKVVPFVVLRVCASYRRGRNECLDLSFRSG